MLDLLVFSEIGSETDLDPETKLWLQLAFTLFQMLIYDPSKRISARRALLHPYFDDLDKMSLPAKPGEYDIKC